MQLPSADKGLPPHRLRNLIAATALSIGAIVATNAVVLAQLRQNTWREVQTDLLRQSLTLSELVEHTFQSVDLVLAGVAGRIRNDDFNNGDPDNLTSQDYYFFSMRKRPNFQVYSISIIDANGPRLNQSRDWPSPTADVSQRPYFRPLKQNPRIASFIGEPVRDNASGDWVVILARPVLSKNDKFLGVVFASTALKYFDDLFRSTSLGGGYAATLMWQVGTLLARYPTAGNVGTIVPASVSKALADAGSEVSRATNPIDRPARIAAAYRLLRYPPVVVTTLNEKAAFAPWRTTTITISVIASILIAIIVVAACLIVRSWKQKEWRNAVRTSAVKSDRDRALAEAELNRQRDLAEQNKRFAAAVENLSHGRRLGRDA
jgi:Cache domain